MRYFISLCKMDTQAGANPLHHAYLMFSKQAALDGPIEVIDAFGYYSEASSTTNPFIKGLKWCTNTAYDLQNTHGRFKRELLRHIDGPGISGISFEVNETQFDTFYKKMSSFLEEQEQVITELNDVLASEGRPLSGPSRLREEKKRALETGRPLRLKHFDIRFGLNRKGLTSEKSHSCKTVLLDLLLEANIIDNTLRKRILGGQLSHAFPLYSDVAFAPIRLVSIGKPCREEYKGNVYFNRKWQDKEWPHNHLYWTQLPHLIDVPDTPSSSENETSIIVSSDPTGPQPSENGHPLANAHGSDASSKTMPEAKQDPKTYQHHYQLINTALNEIRALELKLLQLQKEPIEKAKKDLTPHKKDENLQLQILRLQEIYHDLSNANKNQHLDSYLKPILKKAQEYKDVAEFTLNPMQVNASLALRMYRHIGVRCALLCMVGIFIAAYALTGPASYVLVTAGVACGLYNTARFFKSEIDFARAQKNYNAFMHPLSPQLSV